MLFRSTSSKVHRPPERKLGDIWMNEQKCIKPNTESPDRSVMLKMERCAEFLARMIEKYGREVLAEMEAGESEEKENREQ